MTIVRLESISSVRLWTSRVLEGIAILFLGAVLFYFVVLYVSAAGPVPWSVDSAIRRG
jgi:hypothetical protein